MYQSNKSVKVDFKENSSIACNFVSYIVVEPFFHYYFLTNLIYIYIHLLTLLCTLFTESLRQFFLPAVQMLVRIKESDNKDEIDKCKYMYFT